MRVRLGVYSTSRQNKRYEQIQVGYQVRVMLKKNSFTKAHEPNFSTHMYKVIHVGKDGGYLINNPDHRRVWLRHELRLITAAEDKDTED